MKVLIIYIKKKKKTKNRLTENMFVIYLEKDEELTKFVQTITLFY